MRTLVHSPRGLTLLEVMATLMVSTLLLSGAWRLFESGIRSYHRGLQDVQLTQGARTLITMVTRDIQRAMATRLPYSIRGTASQSATTSADEPHTDRLEMLVMPTLPVSGNKDTLFSKAPQRIRYVSTPLPEGRVVALQRATAAVGRDDNVERFLLVHKHVQEFSVRYFDGQHWRSEWQQPEVPRALEIAVSVQGSGAQKKVYRFTTLVTVE